MIPGCTHALDLVLDDETVDLTGAEVYVTLRQGAFELELSGDRVEASGHQATVYLTQTESLKMKDNQNAEIQINWITTDALTGGVSRGASDPASVPVGVQLLRRVLP